MMFRISSAAVAIFALTATAQQQQQQQQLPEPGAVFRSGVALVRVDAQVVDGAKRALAGLSKDDFEVLDEGELQPVVYFGRDSEPLWVTLLLDVSGSMHKRLDEMAAAARTALQSMNADDRIAVMFFARTARVALDMTADLGAVGPVIGGARKERGVGSATVINPAIVAAAGYVGAQAGNKPGRRAVVILTDNEGINYEVKDDVALAALFRADAVLNAIVTPNARPPAALKAGAYVNPDFPPADVFRIARETGGEVLKAERAGETFKDMMQRIRLRYSLHYRLPEPAAPGQARRIQVRLSPAGRRKYAGAEVRARTGYNVPNN
jgi:Ca-activated chloride channel family protein